MLQCTKHQDDLLCECKQKTWKNMPLAKRQMAIKTTIPAMDKPKKGFCEWADFIKMKVKGYIINRKGEVMRI